MHHGPELLFLRNNLPMIMGRGSRPSWAAGAGLWRDFRRSAAGVTDTHAQTIYADDAAGAYSAFAANAVVRTNRGLQTRQTKTNKCTNYNANPTDLTNFNALAGDPAGVLTVVDDSAALAAAGLSGICTSGKVFKLDNSAGSSIVVATIGGFTGNTNPHTVSVWSRVTGGTGRVEMSGNIGRITYSNAAYERKVSANLTPTDGLRQVAITATAGTIVYFILNQLEEAAFAGPPIVTTGAAATVNGNQQVIAGLGAQLAAGVYGFVQVDLRGGGNFVSLLHIHDDTTNNRAIITTSSDGSITRLDVTSGGAGQAAVSIGSTSLTQQTIAFAVGTNYAMARRVGDAAPTADTAVTYPSGMSKIAFGSLGINAGSNMFGNTRLLGLWYGQPDAAKFDAVYAKAVQAHALAA